MRYWTSSSSSASSSSWRTIPGEGDTGSGSCSSSGDEKMTEEFPYGRAFKAAMGRVTTFPDGTEAVMIDSAIALEAFQQEQMKNGAPGTPTNTSSSHKTGYARPNSLEPEIRR